MRTMCLGHVNQHNTRPSAQWLSLSGYQTHSCEIAQLSYMVLSEGKKEFRFPSLGGKVFALTWH